MRLGAAAVTIFVASAQFSHAGSADDAKVLTLVRTHCVMCHAEKPKHKSVQEAPENIRLETIADVKKHAAAILRTNGGNQGNAAW